jgi:beta-lactamase superfamily II metal-dependent hydrolase
MATGTVEVRMYNVGFGDAFRITVRRGDETWRMLVDCGVHSHGAARPLAESVKQIIDDLAEDCGGTPHLDVVVGTHHHRDHIYGFADDRWAAVDVDEVWVPFVEDEADADAKGLREAQTRTAQKLAMLIDDRVQKLATNQREAKHTLALAMAMAGNSRGNTKATERLLGRNGMTFATPKHAVRFLPDKDLSKNTIQSSRCGVVADILGPPRDPGMLKKMNPPKNAGWLTLSLDDVVDAAEPDDVDPSKPAAAERPKGDKDIWPLFNRTFVITDHAQVPDHLQKAKTRLKLNTLSNDMGLLAAASVLEQSVNNTSLFFVLEIGGLRLLFPGDAQYGAWESIRNDPKSLDLISNVDFYKMGHHGSHNATPMSFIETQWKKPGDTMVPWGLVELWKDSIPYPELIDALTANHHRVIKPNKDTVGANPASELVETEWWSQLTFKVGE